jgi:hypothetical protein
MVELYDVLSCVKQNTTKERTGEVPTALHLPVAALQSEGSIQNVSPDDLAHRQELVLELRKLPPSALSNIRHFQTQIGCLNRCGFCSQHAGSVIWNMPRNSLANLISALKTVCLENAIGNGRVSDCPLTQEGVFSNDFAMPKFGLLGNERKDRPGVIYCYLDNDPAAYPYLDDMIQWLHDDLGVKVRIATVGYSSSNQMIVEMHERISKTLTHGLAGLRLSFSPYTYGWTQSASRTGQASRDQFERDTAVLLQTYRGLFLSERKGRKGACVELRFRPLIKSKPVQLESLDGRMVIRSGSYLVVQAQAGESLDLAQITDPRRHDSMLDVAGSPCFVVRAPEQLIEADWVALTRAALREQRFESPQATVYPALLHRLKNEDGEYFAVDAERTSHGDFSKFFYVDAPSRPGQGMIDGERYHMNALIAAGTENRNRTWADVELIMDDLKAQSDGLLQFDPTAAAYIKDEILTLVESYVRILKQADYPATSYFDKNISVDTGHICNLGRAFTEYDGIASRSDLPLTPKHERAFGAGGELAEEGIAWRIAVAPLDQARNARGERNAYQEQPAILVESLDLAMTATTSGQSKERYFLRDKAVERISVNDSKWFPMIPGHLFKKVKIWRAN